LKTSREPGRQQLGSLVVPGLLFAKSPELVEKKRS